MALMILLIDNLVVGRLTRHERVRPNLGQRSRIHDIDRDPIFRLSRLDGDSTESECHTKRADIDELHANLFVDIILYVSLARVIMTPRLYASRTDATMQFR